MKKLKIKSRVIISEETEQITEDRISKLPDALISSILSLLPTRCAARTSILSTRWRYLHRFTNSLSFDTKRVLSKSVFKEFVNKTISSHQLPGIDRFRFDCDITYRSEDLYRWISFAVLRGAKEIDLRFSSKHTNPAALPTPLFMCRTVVVLKIHSEIKNWKVPDTVSLPNLHVLHLSYIRFKDDGSIVRLISGCLALKELRLEACKWSTNNQNYVNATNLENLAIIHCRGRIEFDASNLTQLEFNCYKDLNTNLYLKDASSLAKAMLRIPFPELRNPVDSVAYRQSALTLLNLCSYNASELHLMANSLELFVYAEDDYIPTCPNLVKLHLGCCSHEEWKYITYILAYSPKLETVIFAGDLTLNNNPPENIALEPFSSRLKVIEVYRFSGSKSGLSILQHLLKNCRVLKKMILKTSSTMTKDEKLQLSKKILMLERASKRCIIQMK